MVCGGGGLQSKRVCVIGAGMAGLAAARELRQEGHVVTIMEQSHDIGGQWLYDPRTDHGDLLGAAGTPPKVHSSMYASLRLVSPREVMGFADFPFAATKNSSRDPRRFPGHREVYLYLKDFCDAFGLMEVVRLNTKVVHVAMAPREGDVDPIKWVVKSLTCVDQGGDEEEAAMEEEVFDAVVVATGHYSQPRLPFIQGMDKWTMRQLHSHSYRVPDPFSDEVLVIAGCGDSGSDISLELRKVAKEVHVSVKSMEQLTVGFSKAIANYDNLQVHLQMDRLCEDGQVVFVDGSCVVADTIIYCTGYSYSFPFLETEGRVVVDDNRVGPLYEHTFPPSLAPSLSFIGIPRKVVVPFFFGVQARWVAQVLSGRRTLPSGDEMMRSVEEHYRSMKSAGIPKRYTHDIANYVYCAEYGEKYCDFPRLEEWKRELTHSAIRNMLDELEAFRDEFHDSELVWKGLQSLYLAQEDTEAVRAWDRPI